MAHWTLAPVVLVTRCSWECGRVLHHRTGIKVSKICLALASLVYYSRIASVTTAARDIPF